MQIQKRRQRCALQRHAPRTRGIQYATAFRSPARRRMMTVVNVGQSAQREASGYAHSFRRHCELTGRRNAPPDVRLREAIHIAGSKELDCFVASLLAMTTNRT